MRESSRNPLTPETGEPLPKKAKCTRAVAGGLFWQKRFIKYI